MNSPRRCGRCGTRFVQHLRHCILESQIRPSSEQKSWLSSLCSSSERNDFTTYQFSATFQLLGFNLSFNRSGVLNQSDIRWDSPELLAGRMCPHSEPRCQSSWSWRFYLSGAQRSTPPSPRSRHPTPPTHPHHMFCRLTFVLRRSHLIFWIWTSTDISVALITPT